MNEFLKKTGWASILTSIIFALVGLIMILFPGTTMFLISVIMGIFFILMGIVKIVTRVSEKQNTLSYFATDIAWGVVAVILGLVVMVYSGTIESILRIIIGIWIIYSGCVRFATAFEVKSVNKNLWITILVLSIIMLIAGIYVTFCSGALITTLGVIILAYAILDIVESFIFMKNIE